MLKFSKILSEVISEDIYSGSSGDCDIFAIALHRLRGYPIYAVRGYYWDDVFDEKNYEDAHYVVKSTNGKYLDSEGEISKNELIDLAVFNNIIDTVSLVEVSENEVMANYSCDYEQDIKNVMNKMKVTESKEKNQYIVYHGTNDKFDEFDPDKTVDGTFWFTDSVDSIKNHTTGGVGNKYIMKRKITLNNPAGWDEYEQYSIGELISMGYDGVILPEDDVTDFIVFDKKSIERV
jgi:hypothetical protein